MQVIHACRTFDGGIPVRCQVSAAAGRIAIVILGSGDLIRSLMPHGLVDRFVLLIHPLVLGTGQRLFADERATAELRSVDTTTTPKGVVIATYEAT